MTAVRGRVYAANGNSVPDGTVVSAKSLDSAFPFEGSATTTSGSYVLNGVPLDAQLELSATRPGWTKRVRVVVARAPRPGRDENLELDFGGPGANDPLAPSFYLDNHPEIATITPVDGDTSLPNDRLRVVMTMSEPLDAANQRRLAAAFLVVPNSREALAETAALPEASATTSTSATGVEAFKQVELAGLNAGANPRDNAAYRFRQNAGFMNGAKQAKFTWNAEGTQATFELEAPIKTGNTAEGKYAVLLVAAEDNVIRDAEALPLGQDKEKRFGNYREGDLIFNAIAEPTVSMVGGLSKDEDRWADTHLSYVAFGVLQDTVAPELTAVRAFRNYADDGGLGHDRLELTFSEPMQAFPAIRGRELLSLNNYLVTMAVTNAELADRDLADAAKATGLSSSTSLTDARAAFAGAFGAVVDGNSDLLSGGYSVALSVVDPKVVILRYPPGSFPLTAEVVKARPISDAGRPSSSGRGVTDPAGNAATDKAAVGVVQ